MSIENSIRVLIILLLSVVSLTAKAQFVDSTTGLLSAPSADMNKSGVFMVTNNFLNEHITPDSKTEFPWDYHTFGYGFSITFWSRLEIAYVCTLFNGAWSPSATTERQKIVKNQDRHFAAKVLALKEGEIWTWTPSIAVGISDPISGSNGDYIGQKASSTANGFFNRYYAVASKHFQTRAGDVGAHFGYQYSVRTDWDRTGPIAAIDWKPIWLQNRWFYPKFIIEYDANTVNAGFISSIWDDRFEAMFILQNFKWISFGLRFQVRLAGAEK